MPEASAGPRPLLNTDDPYRIYFCSMNRAAHLPLVWGCLRAAVEAEKDLAPRFHFARPAFFLGQEQGLLADLDRPALFLASCYVWNMRKNLAICREVRRRFPNVVIIVGGPHVPDVPTSLFADEPCIDYAVHGEGERPFTRLLAALCSDERDLSTIPGLTWRCGDVAVTNPGRDGLPKDIDLASPYLAGHFEDCVEEARAARLEPIALWETNRGCPYNCTFCDWGSATFSKIKQFRMDRLTSEIRWFADHRIDSILCCDANFGILPRDIEITRALSTSRLLRGYPRKFVTNWAKNPRSNVPDMSRLLVASGLAAGTILAMQTATAKSLEYTRRANIPMSDYRKLAGALQERGVRVYTELILGLPGETLESWRNSLVEILATGIEDDLMTYECVVLPNSEMNLPAYRAAHGLQTVTRPFLPGDVESVEVVVGTAAMPPADWVAAWRFTTMIQALHCLGLTRPLATYLRRSGRLALADFYPAMSKHFTTHPDTLLEQALGRITRLFADYQLDPALPLDGKVETQPDMLESVTAVAPDKMGWLYHEWVWAVVVQDLPRFSRDLEAALQAIGIEVDPVLEDLLRFQQDAIFSPDYDLRTGRTAVYAFDWKQYFASEAQREPCPGPTRVVFAGPSRQRVGRNPGLS